METTTENLNKQGLLLSYDKTISELLQVLSSFNEKELNVIPFEGSWTAGQVGEHLLKSGFGIAQILKGNTQPTKGSVDEKVETLERIFLDFTNKSKSAEAVTPSGEPKEKEKLIAELKAKMDEIRNTAVSMDLSQTCMDFPFPTLGELTRWEWISFAMCHTQRHIHQIKNIYKKTYQ